MKYVFYLLLFALLGFTIQSCEKDEGKRPAIEFKTGGNYTSSDITVTGGTVLTVGIHAAKTEENDVLKKFNVTVFLEGVQIDSQDTDLTGANEDAFDADFTFTVPPTAGLHYKLTFTVTSLDGLTNQVSLTVTAS